MEKLTTFLIVVLWLGQYVSGQRKILKMRLLNYITYKVRDASGKDRKKKDIIQKGGRGLKDAIKDVFVFEVIFIF